MRFCFAILLVAILAIGANPALAGQAEVRETARLNNCPPKKIDVYQQALGLDGRTVYRVQCNLPKATDETTKNADTLLIGCRGNLCEVLRPMEAESK